MKKRLFLVLWLLCGIVLPLSTQAHEDWIYTWLVDENWIWVITVIWSGIKMTLKAENQTWTYRRWNNIAWDSTNYYGAENNDRWWWSGDTYENWFNPNPTNFTERQWPCDTWYHVPSRWERNELVTARCNLTTWCTLTESYDQNKNSWSNKLIKIRVEWMWTKFKQDFSMADYDFWLSSPYQDNVHYSWNLYINFDNVDPGNYGYRNSIYHVRCLRNSIVAPAPQTFTLSFTESEWGSVSTWSIEAEEWSSITMNTGAGTVQIWDVTVTATPDEWYAFSWWLTDCDGDTVTTGCNFTGVFKLIPYTITYLWTWDDYVPSATGFTIESGNITLTEPSKTWYTFTWRSGTNIEWITWTVTISKWSTWDRIYEANWEANEYTITIDIDGNETILTWKYGDPISKPSDPSKNGYKFIGWEPEFPTTMPLSGATVKAKWEKLWSSGGWGGRSSSSVISSDSEKSTEWETWNQGNSQLAEQNSMEPHPNPLLIGEGNLEEVGEVYTQEFQEAYEFAHEKWITTMPTIQEAQMDWKLTRIAMAKMLSQYAMNVLGQKPANIVTPKFNDVTDKQNSDYDDWVILAYQLWIMWQNMPWNNFRPNDEVTRAEFATALSRMAYWTSDWEYKATSKYYVHHMKKLVEEWIITKDDPKMKELRWYVMIMLMRSAK